MTLRTGLFVAPKSGGDGSDGMFPQGARLALAGLLSGVGVLSGGAVTGSTSGPNMKYTVAAGVFVTARGSIAADGLYVTANDGPFTVDSLTPAPSSGTRWDLIWVRQKNAFDGGFGDADSEPEFGVTVGNAGSTASKPYSDVPAGALVLAESNVGTGIPDSSTAAIATVAATVGAVTNNTSGWVAIGVNTNRVVLSINDGSLNAVYREGVSITTRGVISPKAGTSWTAGQNITAVLLLPAGYRPGVQPVIRRAAGNNGSIDARLSVNPDGTVDLLIGNTPPNVVDISCLSGFIAEN